MKPTKKTKSEPSTEAKAPEPEKPPYQMTAEDKAAVPRVHARRSGLPKLPRATLTQEGTGITVGFDHDDQPVAHTVLMDALGISGADFCSGYVHQVVSVATTGKT